MNEVSTLPSSSDKDAQTRLEVEPEPQYHARATLVMNIPLVISRGAHPVAGSVRHITINSGENPLWPLKKHEK